MKQDVFERRYEQQWAQFAEWLEDVDRTRRDPDTTADLGDSFPAAYRSVCHHLALARARRYGLELQQRLNDLALRGHQHLYSRPVSWREPVVRFLLNGFPVAFRRHWRFMLVSFGLFYVPLIAMLIAMQWRPELVYSLLSGEQVHSIERMYDPTLERLGRERQSDTDLMMFGFYIYNNISIGFRTFAGGLLFGLGSLFFLIFNGVYIGAVAGHLTQIGFTETFYTFVIAHGSVELTAIGIFGGAGLVLGYAALAPGPRTRWQAIRAGAVSSLPLVYGGTLFLTLAAFIEAFWSSTTWPVASVKYAVGGVLWLLVFAYLGLVGRDESR